MKDEKKTKSQLISELEELRKELAEPKASVTRLKKKDIAGNEADCFREVVENIKLLAVMLDSEGNVTYCNDHFCEQTRWKRKEILGQNWFDEFLPSETRNEVKALFAKMVGKGQVPFTHENEMLTRNGDKRLIAWHNTVLRDRRKKIIGAAALGEDVTECRRLQMEVRSTLDQLERRVEERTRELREKGNSLEEVNAAMKMLVEAKDQSRKELEDAISANMRKLVLPYIEKLKNTSMDSEQATFLSIVESHLYEITSPFINRLSEKFIGLTPMEMRVADLIKEGRTSKSIAQILDLTEATIIFHRNNLRGKLGLKSKKVNLKAYLQSFR